MQFNKFQFMKAWDWIAIIPTIIISINELVYQKKNFRVSLHWLGWHLSWQWIERRDDG